MIEEYNRKIACIRCCDHRDIKTVTSSHRMDTAIITTYEINITHYSSFILEHSDPYRFEQSFCGFRITIIFMIAISTIDSQRGMELRKWKMEIAILYYVERAIKNITSKENQIRAYCIHSINNSFDSLSLIECSNMNIRQKCNSYTLIVTHLSSFICNGIWNNLWITCIDISEDQPKSNKYMNTEKPPK